MFDAVDVAIVIRFALSFFGFLLFSGAAKIYRCFSFSFISFRFIFFFVLVCYSIPCCCHTRAVCRWEMTSKLYVRRFSFRMTAINIHILYFRVVCWIGLPVFVASFIVQAVLAVCRCAIVCVQTRAAPFVRESDWYTWCVRGRKVIRKTNNSSLDLSVI